MSLLINKKVGAFVVKKASLAERLKMSDNIAKKINEKMEKEIVGRISNSDGIQNKIKHKYIPTPSINVNEAIGGGFPIGNTTIISGEPDSGKTAYLLETISKNQKENPDFVALWLESEASIKSSTLEMFGIDTSRLIFVEHEREGAGEVAIDIIESYLVANIVDMVVINSLKCLVPSEEFKKDMVSSSVALQARMNAKMMRKLTSIVQENEVAMVIVQHLSTQIGAMMRDPLILSGGKAIVYGAAIILDYRKRSILDSDPIKKEEGMKIGVTVRKNHIVTDRYPYVKTQYYIVYGKGTEKYLEVIELAINQGILKKSGAFIQMIDENGEVKIINEEKMQWKGISKFRQYCIDNEEFFNNLTKMIQGETINLTEEEIEKYACDDSYDEDEIEDVIAIAKENK